MPVFENGSSRSYLGKPEPEVGVVGPVKGFSPQVGILVSMMVLTRLKVLKCVSGLSVRDLDYLVDANANIIGAMLLHFAATETFYQLNMFEGIGVGSVPEEFKKQGGVPVNLGEPARRTIKDNNIDYYMGVLQSVREKTLAEFRRRDDDWLAITEVATVEGEYKGMSFNNFFKWFHVAEHESHHSGQIKFIKSRIPQGH